MLQQHQLRRTAKSKEFGKAELLLVKCHRRRDVEGGDDGDGFLKIDRSHDAQAPGVDEIWQCSPRLRARMRRVRSHNIVQQPS